MNAEARGPGPRTSDDPFDLDVADARWRADGLVDAARAAARAALAGRDGSRASLRLTDDAEMRALNRTWRNLDRPTNVLAFPARGPLPAGAPRELGDVAIGYETAVREAGERGLPAAHHLAHLVVHGILHLAGHDHDTDAAAARMEADERARLAALGIADPYAAPAEGGGRG